MIDFFNKHEDLIESVDSIDYGKEDIKMIKRALVEMKDTNFIRVTKKLESKYFLTGTLVKELFIKYKYVEIEKDDEDIYVCFNLFELERIPEYFDVINNFFKTLKDFEQYLCDLSITPKEDLKDKNHVVASFCPNCFRTKVQFMLYNDNNFMCSHCHFIISKKDFGHIFHRLGSSEHDLNILYEARNRKNERLDYVSCCKDSNVRNLLPIDYYQLNFNFLEDSISHYLPIFICTKCGNLLVSIFCNKRLTKMYRDNVASDRLKSKNFKSRIEEARNYKFNKTYRSENSLLPIGIVRCQ